MPTIQIKVLKISKIENFQVSLLFNNNEIRTVNFESFFKELPNFSEQHPAYKLVMNLADFQQIEIIGSTVGWKNTGIYSKDFEGNSVFYPFDLDPTVLYQNSVLTNVEPSNI